MSKTNLKILLFTDVGANAEHSSVEGLFKTRPKSGIYCDKIFFDKQIHQPVIGNGRTVFPHCYRRKGLVKMLRLSHIEINQYKIIIVRNLFSVLSQILRAKPDARIGFWESFPHSHRRLDQALYENKAVMRKRLEYAWAQKKERRLISRCDFYLPITQTHKSVFYPDLHIPYLPTPMGFDFENYPTEAQPNSNGPIRFVYIGTIDKLRKFGVINDAFTAQTSDFVLDYYSFDQNMEVDRIRLIGDRRIRFHGGFSRDALFNKISSADVGICFFPHTKTHITASPTKTLEYGALGLTVLVNPMPEYEMLLDDDCAFICDFEKKAIHDKVQRILAMDRQSITQMGVRLQQRIRTQRDYAQMAKRLFSFLKKIADNSIQR